jgi:hypothetical protein
MPKFLRDRFSYGGRIKINDSFKDESVGKNVKKYFLFSFKKFQSKNWPIDKNIFSNIWQQLT